MTPRSLFNIILKIFGLLFLKEIVYNIPQLLSSIFYLTKDFNFVEGLGTLIISLIILSFYTYLVFQLLFKTNQFIDRLKLDQGFDEHEFSFEQTQKFQINISMSLVLTIALIVVGCTILVDQIPNFFRQVYVYIQEKSQSHTSSDYDFSFMFISGIKIIIGLLIIGERARIIEFIESHQKKKTVDIKEEKE